MHSLNYRLFRYCHLFEFFCFILILLSIIMKHVSKRIKTLNFDLEFAQNHETYVKLGYEFQTMHSFM